MVTVIDTTTPVAKKTHTCSWCDTSINPGEKYHRARLIGDDGPYVWKACAACQALVADVDAWLGYADEGISPDCFAEWADEHPDDARAVAYLERVEAAREAWAARYGADGQD